MNRRRLWLGGLAVAFAIGLVALGRVALDRLDFFRIGSVEVEGIRHLDERAVVARLGIPSDAHILVPLAPIAAAAESLPGVRHATVSRRWPGTIRVAIREAPAVALAVRDGRVIVLDDRGQLLPIDPRRLESSLPLADDDSTVAALLARLQVTDPQWYRMVDRAAGEHGEVVLSVGSRTVRLEAGAGSDVLRDLAAVRDWLAEKGIAWQAIDARFDGRMFVRKEAA